MLNLLHQNVILYAVLGVFVLVAAVTVFTGYKFKDKLFYVFDSLTECCLILLFILGIIRKFWWLWGSSLLLMLVFLIGCFLVWITSPNTSGLLPEQESFE